MKYRKGYKYQLAETESFYTSIDISDSVHTEFISLFTNGKLIINSGFSWDGPSGPTIDSPSSMRGSLMHDALYQLMRMKLLDRSWRDIIDRDFYNCLLADRMWGWRAKYWYKSVNGCLADFASDPRNLKKVYVAP